MFYDKNQYFIQSIYGNIKNEDNLSENFVHKYSQDKTGLLVFQIYLDSPLYGRIPVSNAKITINGELDNGLSMTKVTVSDESGKTEPIPLPTVSGQLSFDPQTDRPYSTYSAIVETADYLLVNVSNIPIFENVTSIQPISLIPKTNSQISAFLEIQSDYFSRGR